jgi:alpha-amylase
MLTNPRSPAQDQIRSDIIGWLQYLKTVGFDGWRFDFVRGYGGQYIKTYIDSTVRDD